MAVHRLKGHKPETFVEKKKNDLAFFGISLPDITSSAIEVKVSRIPDGFSV